MMKVTAALRTTARCQARNAQNQRTFAVAHRAVLPARIHGASWFSTSPATVPVVTPSLKLEYYKRDLPSTCIPFTSPEGKRLFSEALRAGTLECYFPLAAQFRTQEEPAYCGLTTLVMVLNALSIDPRRLWKGPWRWFSEDMLDCCRPLPEIKERGIDLNVFMCLAGCHSAAAEVYRPPVEGATGPVTEESFRSTVMEMSKKAEHEFLVLSYSRQALGQTGSGHFSPMGGYHEGEDMVLVLDVARFKYMPHWVPVSTMWKAMQAVDEETKLPRGYVKMRRRAAAPLLFFQIATHPSDFTPGQKTASACLHRRLRSSLEQSVAIARDALLDQSSAAANSMNLADVVALFVRTFTEASKGRESDLNSSRCVDKLSKEHIEVAGSLVTYLENTPLFPIIRKIVTELDAEKGGINCSRSSVLLKFDGQDPLMSKDVQPSWKAEGCKTCGVSCIFVTKTHVLTLLLLAFASPNSQGCSTKHRTQGANLLCATAGKILSDAPQLLQQEVSLLADQLRAAATTLNVDDGTTPLMLHHECHTC